MTVLGLTGGIASGKSYVAALLAERGAVVLDADRHAHGVLAEPGVLEVLTERWGRSVLAEDGSLRRSEVARRVFGDSPEATAERRFLEGVVHPRVRERLRAELEIAEAAGTAVAVLDIPLLIEAGWADECDAILFIDTPLEERRRRAAARGWSPDELARREAAQVPLETKRLRADFIVPGDDPEGARLAIAEVWRRFG
jgi:dephospho-CoA kinase